MTMKRTSGFLAESEVLSSVFHVGILQHNQIYLYNNQHSLKEMTEQDKMNYLPLNEANLLLGRFCRRILNDATCKETLPTGLCKEADGLLMRWRECYKSGELYNTFTLASRIMHILRQANLNLDEVIADDTELCTSFLNVTYHIKSFFQYHIIVPTSLFSLWCELIVDAARRDRSLFYYVRELTVHTSPAVLKRKSGAQCSMVRIKLVPELVNSMKNPVLGEIKSVLSKSIHSMDVEDNEVDIYAEKVGELLYVSQGNNNYKKFLNLLGLLPLVYDANNSYAYLIPNCGFNHRNN